LIKSSRGHKDSFLNTARPGTTFKGKRYRNLSQDADMISVASNTIENDRMSARTIAPSMSRTHRKLLFIQPGKYINNYAPKTFRGKKTQFSDRPGTRTGYFPTSQSEIASFVFV